MALLTVGAGALLVGRDIVGLAAAVRIDEVLWTVGTASGLLSVIAIPYLMFTDHNFGPEDVSATWLMPVVPPMVSAATGAALIEHLSPGQPRLTLLLVCYALFGISLLASLITITLVWGRLLLRGPGPARLVPTLWIVLGPLGQSVTAAGLLGAAAASAIPARCVRWASSSAYPSGGLHRFGWPLRPPSRCGSRERTFPSRSPGGASRFRSARLSPALRYSPCPPTPGSCATSALRSTRSCSPPG
jgi:tellurite resistance protein TehA-like permease